MMWIKPLGLTLEPYRFIKQHSQILTIISHMHKHLETYIAQQNFGEGVLYVQVFEANRDKIKDPDLIYPGQIFKIPAN